MLDERLLFKLNVLCKKLEEDILPLSNINNFRDIDINIRYSHIFRDLFPNLNDEEIKRLLLLLKLINDRCNENSHKVEVVFSGVTGIDLRIRETVGVIRQILSDASECIIMTGYAISSYFHQLGDLLRGKAGQGVKIELFVESSQNENLSYLLEYSNIENLKIYKYNSSSRYSALHAKTIVVDHRIAFITSANLSYNGMINNIEIGALIEGRQVGNIVRLFEELKTRGFFESIN